MWWGTDHSTAERTLVEWVVEAKAGDRVGVVARHERAGTARGELVVFRTVPLCDATGEP